MSNRILNLVFKADTAAAKSALKDLEGTEGQPGGVAGLSLALSKAQLLWSAYGTAAVLAGKQIGEEIDKYTDYVGRVEELRDGLNLSAEDASYLTGMMEEHGISVSTLMNIFEDLSEKGIDPSVQSLMDVMTELDKYPEGSERTSKAMDALGKEGIGPLMDWWSDLTQEQRDNIDLLRGEYTEVTNEVITETGEFDAAVGDLRTEWIGFRNDILVSRGL